MEQSQKLIYRWEVVLNTLPYLTISELTSSATISKQWMYMLKKYINKFVLPKQLQTGDQLKQLKALYNREIHMYTPNQLYKTPLNYLIKKITQGTYVTALTLLNDKHILLKNELVKNGIKDKSIEINLPKNYSNVVCSGDYIYCIQECNVTKYKTTDQYDLIDEKMILFKEPIEHIAYSTSHLLVFTGITSQLTRVFAISHKQFKQFELPSQQIKKDNISLGNNVCYVIKNQEAFFIDLKHSNQQLKHFKPLKGKNIAKIKCGWNHFIAFQRSKKLLKNWNTAQVIQWAQQEEFDDYIKIFKAEKMTGTKLLNMDLKYMIDVLGISNVKVQQKMNLRIQQNNEQNYDNYVIYGWGINDKGQLGQNIQLNCTNPQKLKLPENMEVWHCESNYTFLKNRKTNAIYINNVKNEERWVKLTDQKIWNLCTFKDHIVYVVSEGKTDIPQALSEDPLNNKKQKLRTAKNIIDQILWDQHYDKKEFRVGFLDKFTGMLQSSLEQLFLSEVKQYRIVYFKRNNEVVWDKNKRIDLL